MNQANHSEGLRAVPTMGTDAGLGQELFALTDEQILEIEPSSQGSAENGIASANESVASAERIEAGNGKNAVATPVASASAAAVSGAEPPQWLAERMADPRSGAEARDFWNGVTQARQDAAAYREVFAGPAEARAAAERARVLDEIDGAYFAGDAGARSKLAATMLREDPAAFREMVFEGLRALQGAENGGGASSVSASDSRLARAFGGVVSPAAAPSTSVTSAENAAAGSTGVAGHHGSAQHDARMAAYAAFEKSANEDLERSVGAAIGRTLEQALPVNGRGDNTALKSRLVGAIRQDVEKALQGDRQLGEQVTQLLSGKRLNSETRAQVVRLIGERAEQLVPGAAKRILSDWTQTTLAAHREKSGRGTAAASRAEVATVAAGGGAGRGDGREAAGSVGRGNARGGVDYRKFSDEQILAM